MEKDPAQQPNTAEAFAYLEENVSRYMSYAALEDPALHESSYTPTKTVPAKSAPSNSLYADSSPSSGADSLYASAGDAAKLLSGSTPAAAPSPSADSSVLGSYTGATVSYASTEGVSAPPAASSHPKVAPVEKPKDRRKNKVPDWNRELQELLEAEESSEKYLDLAALTRDFNYAAETFGKIIISEMAFPDELKTIKSTKAGGSAGGQKYIHKNIFFKFAIDMYGIYGGDEYAMKAAEHDLKGLVYYASSGVKKLHTPLMCLIDYLGYRLIALCTLPLTSTTLKYGSADAGQTIHTDIPELNSLMESAGAKLNLKKHKAGAPGNMKKEIVGPVDIEGHFGLDTRFYVLDYARTFPPEAFKSSSPLYQRSQHLYKLLRPELVTRWPSPLSSDAFSAWGSGDTESNREVSDCTESLFNEIIPGIRKTLVLLLRTTLSEDSTKNSAQSLDLIVNRIHQQGINIRHLGRIRRALRELPNDFLPDAMMQAHEQMFLSEVLLLEMVARVAKNWIRKALRESTLQNPMSEEPCRKAVVPILNVILGCSADASHLFWTKELKQKLSSAFHDSLTAAELADDFDLRSVGSMKWLLPRITSLTKITFSDEVSKATLNPNDESAIGRIIASDIVRFEPRLRATNLMDTAEAMSLVYEARDQSGDAEALRLLEKALELFLRALDKIQFVLDPQVLLQLARMFLKLADRDAEKKAADRHWKGATKALSTAIELRPTDASMMAQLANIHASFGKYAEAEKELARAREFARDPLALSMISAALGDSLYMQGYKEKARVAYEEALQRNTNNATALWMAGICDAIHACYSSSPMELEKISAAQSSMLKALDIDPAVNENAVAKFSSKMISDERRSTLLAVLLLCAVNGPKAAKLQELCSKAIVGKGELDFSECQVSDAAFTLLCQSVLPLHPTAIYLNKTALTSAAFESGNLRTPIWDRVVQLSFSDIKLSDSAVEEILNLISQKKLCVLKTEHCELSANSAEKLAASRLETCSLTQTAVETELWPKFFSANPNLKVLRLAGPSNKGGYSPLPNIDQIACVNVTELALNFCTLALHQMQTLIKALPHLRFLDLFRAMGLTVAQLNALMIDSDVKTLVLPNNGVFIYSARDAQSTGLHWRRFGSTTEVGVEGMNFRLQGNGMIQSIAPLNAKIKSHRFGPNIKEQITVEDEKICEININGPSFFKTLQLSVLNVMMNASANTSVPSLIIANEHVHVQFWQHMGNGQVQIKGGRKNLAAWACFVIMMVEHRVCKDI